MLNDHPEVYSVQIHSLRESTFESVSKDLRQHADALREIGAQTVGTWLSLPELSIHPVCVEIWEYKSLPHFRSMIATRAVRSDAVGRRLAECNAELFRHIQKSTGWVCARSLESPNASEASQIPQPIMLFEHMFVESGRQAEYARIIERFLKPRFFEPTGRQLIGMYRPLTADGISCFNLWSQAPSWEEYAKKGKMDVLSDKVASDVGVYSDLARFIRKDWRQYLLVPLVM